MNKSLVNLANYYFQVPYYAAAQLTGATTAGFTLHFLLHPIKHVGTTSQSGSDIQALMMEIIVTFSTIFVTSAVATDIKAVRTYYTYTTVIIPFLHW